MVWRLADMPDQTGRVFVVTGANSGIGFEASKALSRKGARVVMACRNLGKAEAARAEVGGDTEVRELDLGSLASIHAFAEAWEGPIDVLVNNAGIMAVGPFDEEDEATVVRQLEINLHAVIHGTKEAVRRMKPRGTGHIVNVASSAGKTGFPHLATYCATKHGVVGMSEAVRGELRGTGVEISVVMPGIVNTELAAGLVETRGFKISTPEDVAELVVEALEFPRFDVFVPKSIGPTWAALQIVPRRAREAFARALKLDRALLDADRDARAAYEARAAASAPGAERERETV